MPKIDGLFLGGFGEGFFGFGGIHEIEAEEVAAGFDVGGFDVEAVAVVGGVGDDVTAGVFAPFLGGAGVEGGGGQEAGGESEKSQAAGGRVHGLGVYGSRAEGQPQKARI
jgi:hypothetical protein